MRDMGQRFDHFAAWRRLGGIGFARSDEVNGGIFRQYVPVKHVIEMTPRVGCVEDVVMSQLGIDLAHAQMQHEA